MKEAATAALEAEDEIYYHYGKEPTPFEESAPCRTCSTRAIGRRQALLQPHRHHGKHRLRGFRAGAGQGVAPSEQRRVRLQDRCQARGERPCRLHAHVTYPSGHRDTLEVACRRAVLTGVNQTGAKLQEARMDEMGGQLRRGDGPRRGRAPVMLCGRAGATTGRGLWTTRASTTRISSRPPATAPARGFAAGTAATPSSVVFPELGSPPRMDAGEP